MIARMIELRRPELAVLCRRFGVRRLELFGSAVAGDFDPARSDLDFLVEFDESAPGGLDGYFGLKEALEARYGRAVDLVVAGAVRNPYLRESIERSCAPLYEA
jgi:predicted nucleotidyltransferase